MQVDLLSAGSSYIEPTSAAGISCHNFIERDAEYCWKISATTSNGPSVDLLSADSSYFKPRLAESISCFSVVVLRRTK